LISHQQILPREMSKYTNEPVARQMRCALRGSGASY